MKIAINKQKGEHYEVGYYIGNKLNYYLMEKECALKYLSEKNPEKVISNNVVLKLDNEESYCFDDITLRMINVYKKIKKSKFLFLEVKEAVTFHLFKDGESIMLKSEAFLKPSKLQVNKLGSYTKVFQKYLNYTSLFDSLVSETDLSIENIYDGYLKNDYVSKIILEEFVEMIKKDIVVFKKKFDFSEVVLATNFNKKITGPLECKQSGVKIMLEKVNKRDSLRTILYVDSKKEWRKANNN